MRARVYSTENSFLCECNAVYKPEAETLYISGDKSLISGDKSIIDMGEDYLVHYTDATQGVFDFRCGYVGYEQEGALYVLELKVSEIIKTTQRRQDIKMRTNLPIRLSLLDSDDRIRTDPETHRSVTMPAMLRDISAGGIMIDTESELEVNQKIMFPFDKGSSPIMVQAEVLREQARSGAFYRYGCRFYNHNSGKEAVVREYVFRLESARRHKQI